MEYTNKEKLMERIENNYADFKYSLRGVGRKALFDMAGRIAAVKEAYRLLTQEYGWDDENDVNFYLLFRNPLTVIADAWESKECTQDFEDVMFELSCDGRIISQYPLLEGSYSDIIYIGEPDDDRILYYSEI